MNLDPSWTQAISSVVALAIAVGVPIYQEHKSSVRENRQRETDEKRQSHIDKQRDEDINAKLKSDLEQKNILKYNITNFLNFSEYNYQDKYAGKEIQLFKSFDAFEDWLSKELLSNSNPDQRTVLLFGQKCLLEAYSTDYSEHIDELKEKLNNL